MEKAQLHILKFKEYFLAFKEFIQSERGLKIISLLPLFFSWVPVLIYYYENTSIQKVCFKAFALTLFFLVCFFFSYLFSLLPFVGGLLANLIHSIGILAYLSLCFFLVYSELKNKNVEIKVLNKCSNYLEKLLV